MLRRFYSHWLNSYSGIPLKIWFLALVTLINRCGAMVISFISLYMTQQLGYGIKEAGYVLACFGLGAIAGAYIGGILTDKIGYWKVQFWSLILNGIALIAMMFVRDYWLMCATVILMSMISEAFRPAMSISINVNSTKENFTRSISLYRMAANMGWTVAPAVGGWLIIMGWKWLFIVDGLTCILAALALQWLLPPVKQPVSASVVQDKKTKPIESPYKNRVFMGFIFLTFLNAMVFMQFLWTVPLFFRETYQWPENKIGMVVALNGLLVFLIEMPLIFRIEGRRTVHHIIRWGLIMYALAYLSFLLPFAPLIAALCYIIFISFGEIFVMPFSSNFVNSKLAAGKQGQYVALYTMAYSVANIAAPLLGTQIIAAWGFQTLWIGASALALLVCMGMMRLERAAAL